MNVIRWLQSDLNNNVSAFADSRRVLPAVDLLPALHYTRDMAMIRSQQKLLFPIYWCQLIFIIIIANGDSYNGDWRKKEINE